MLCGCSEERPRTDKQAQQGHRPDAAALPRSAALALCPVTRGRQVLSVGKASTSASRTRGGHFLVLTCADALSIATAFFLSDCFCDD